MNNTEPRPSPTLAWVDAMTAASRGGATTKLRTVAEAWESEPIDGRDPMPTPQTADTLPSASKTEAPRAPAPAFRIVNAFDPPPPPRRFERRYTEDGQCVLVELPPEPESEGG